MKRFRLDGKIALVTGGTGLFGKPITEGLAEAGAQVVIASRNVGQCGEWAAELRREGSRAEGAGLDLSSDASIDACVSGCLSRHGKIDILVNNAVSRQGIRDLEAVTRSDIMEASSVNYAGTVLITRSVVASMREQRSGSIINIGSI